MTPDKTPTPDELEALARKHGATSYRNRADTRHPAYGFTEDGLRNLLADALAKWGSPVVAGEVVAIREAISHFRLTHWADEDGGLGIADALAQLYGDEDIGRASEELDMLADAIASIATPQPTQAQAGAVPLTVDEIEQLIAQWSYELHGDRARYLVRMTELHHGIKGGQHAAD